MNLFPLHKHSASFPIILFHIIELLLFAKCISLFLIMCYFTLNDLLWQFVVLLDGHRSGSVLDGLQITLVRGQGQLNLSQDRHNHQTPGHLLLWKFLMSLNG